MLKHHGSSVTLPAQIVTHHDTIPVYGHQHTICAVQDGSWHDPKTWDMGRLPHLADAVCVPAGLTVQMWCSGACLDLVIAGTLDCRSGFNLDARTITVLPTGHLQAGARGSILFRDLPIDLAFDPKQYGRPA